MVSLNYKKNIDANVNIQAVDLIEQKISSISRKILTPSRQMLNETKNQLKKEPFNVTSPMMMITTTRTFVPPSVISLNKNVKKIKPTSLNKSLIEILKNTENETEKECSQNIDNLNVDEIVS